MSNTATPAWADETLPPLEGRARFECVYYWTHRCFRLQAVTTDAVGWSSIRVGFWELVNQNTRHVVMRGETTEAIAATHWRDVINPELAAIVSAATETRNLHDPPPLPDWERLIGLSP